MVGGSNVRETVSAAGTQLRVGGLSTTLQPAQIFFKPVGDDFHHGLLGMDLLSQARKIRIDFASMTLECRRKRLHRRLHWRAYRKCPAFGSRLKNRQQEERQ
jgi:hypothetical protein